MKKGYYVLATILLAVCVGGCLESAAYFTGGLAAGSELARQQAERLAEATHEAAQTQAEVKALIDEAKVALDAGDVETLKTLAAHLPNDEGLPVEQIVVNAIEAYYNTHGAIAVAKEQGKEPATWIALLLGLTAAYQKVQRSKEKSRREAIGNEITEEA